MENFALVLIFSFARLLITLFSWGTNNWVMTPVSSWENTSTMQNWSQRIFGCEKVATRADNSVSDLFRPSSRISTASSKASSVERSSHERELMVMSESESVGMRSSCERESSVETQSSSKMADLMQQVWSLLYSSCFSSQSITKAVVLGGILLPWHRIAGSEFWNQDKGVAGWNKKEQYHMA